MHHHIIRSRLFILLQKVLPQHLLSHIAGTIATSSWSAKLIPLFIRRYEVRMDEAVHSDPKQYRNFQLFFTRSLKDSARKTARSTLISPCDGTIADFGRIRNDQLLQAKQHSYHLTSLCGDPDCARSFANGHHMTIYLSPKDYHRVHFPCDAKLLRWRYIPGKLFSVNRVTTQYIPGLYAKNERLICHCDSQRGQFLLIMVGAMLVSGIVSQWHGKHQLAQDSDWQPQGSDWQKRSELGKFCFGSTVVLITEQSFPAWRNELHQDDCIMLGQALTKPVTTKKKT